MEVFFSTVQRTEEWFQARVGKVTASKVADVIAKTKTGYSSSRENYLAQLVVERITNKPTETFSNAAMAHGTEQEPFARAAYEVATGFFVEEVGFIDHPTIEAAGASPDGLVNDGLVEIKCPNTATHMDTLLSESVPAKYIPQVQFQMACTGRSWCDFVSFDPRMPEEGQLFIKRVYRDKEYIETIEKEIIKFLSEVDAKTQTLLNKFKEAKK